MKKSLLLVDDDPNILEVLDARFQAAGFITHRAASAVEAMLKLEELHIDLVISDIKMPNLSGIELFHSIQAKHKGLGVIFLTAHGSIAEAVKAVQDGAVDYLTKPFDGKSLVKRVRAYFDTGHSHRPQQQNTTKSSDGYVWGQSPVMLELSKLILRIADNKINTLILGESGVGKECIAQSIHQSSPRKNGPFIVVDCGSTPPGILESELFGHTRGAFTNAVEDKKGLLEAAHGGTLFLDEIGNISAEMQHRLLRFLEDTRIRRVGAIEEKEIDCRILAATNADLTEDIAQGKFRQDLYFRLKVVTINVPPLRERVVDIPELANHFLSRHCKAYNLPPMEIPKETMEWLQNYSWPGNIRELKNSLEAAVVLCNNNPIEPKYFQLEDITNTKNSLAPETTHHPDSLKNSEHDAIIRALVRTGGISTKAAEMLDISRRSLHYKLKKYNINAANYHRE